MTPQEFIIGTLTAIKGNDTTRARKAFSKLTTEQMHQPRENENTSAEILKTLEEHDAMIDAAIAWVKSV
jgi:hypothetical protein